MNDVREVTGEQFAQVTALLDEASTLERAARGNRLNLAAKLEFRTQAKALRERARAVGR